MNNAFGVPQSMVVLGGTSEIASTIVRRLAQEGCRTVVLAGRDAIALATAAAATIEAGATLAPTVTFDARAAGGAAACVDECFASAGPDVDLVLMAVGQLGEQMADEGDPDRTAEMVTVNFTWPATALTAAAARLRRQGHGRVLVLSSVAGVRVRRSSYTYGSAKAGLDAFALGLAESLRDSGVVVQVIRPGFVTTKMTKGRDPAPFATGPDDVASAVVAALGGGRLVVWVPSTVRWVFLALVHLPRVLWRRVPG